MAYKVVEFTRLVTDIKLAIASLITEHKKGAVVNIEELEKGIKQIPETFRERRIQAAVLLRIVAILGASSIPEANKAVILTGAAFYFHDKIKSTYVLRSAENSSFFVALSTILQLETENKPNDADNEKMTEAFLKFFSTHVYKKGKPSQGYLETQLLAGEGFGIPEISAMVHELTDRSRLAFSASATATETARLKAEAEARTEEARLKATSESSSSSSSSSSWASWFGGAAPAKREEGKEEKKSSAPAAN